MGDWKLIYQAMVKGLSRTGLKTFFAFCFSAAFLARWVLVAEMVRASAIWAGCGGGQLGRDKRVTTSTQTLTKGESHRRRRLKVVIDIIFSLL